MKHIEGWVLVGQSNMEGCGLLDHPALDTDVNSKVMTLTSSGESTVAQEPLHWRWHS
jgi:Carbohydrate esterase, sialic acid-specific acetylesterase